MRHCIRIVIALALAIPAELLFAAGRNPIATTSAKPVLSPEPLPSLGLPLDEQFSREERQAFCDRCQIPRADVVFVRRLDLDADGHEDAVVTFALPPQAAGARGRAWNRVTYVFRGTQGASFSLDQASLWFSLNTDHYLSHVNEDEQISRHFWLKQDGPRAIVVVREYTYRDGGGEASARCLRLIESSEKEYAPETLRANPREFD